MRYPEEYSVLDYEQSKCGDCVHDRICARLRIMEELYDPLVRVRITVAECGAYLSRAEIKGGKEWDI